MIDAVINKMGTISFKIIKADIVKGENVVTKKRTNIGSKELTDAIFPVPKNDKNIKSS